MKNDPLLDKGYRISEPLPLNQKQDLEGASLHETSLTLETVSY